MDRNRQVVIIGGGASGMMAALEAGRSGALVTLIEKEPRVGKKLLATGNGRCNFANRFAQARHFHGSNPKIVQRVLALVPVAEVLDTFRLIGVTPKEEAEGKIFPYSGQGSNVLDLLRYEMLRLDVQVLTGRKAVKLQNRQGRWQVHTANGEVHMGHKVVLATGGQAGSQFGADGSGYHLAEQAGHTVTPLYPAIVQIRLQAPWLQALKGVKWQGEAAVCVDDGLLRKETGELLFTEYGISGPPILQLGRLINQYADKTPWLSVCLLPKWESDDIFNELMNRFHLDPDKPAQLCLLGLFHKRMIPVLLREAGLRDLETPARQVPVMIIKQLARLCRDWRISVTGTLSWQHAQVTAGGIDAEEIVPDTMGTRKAPGLYLTGELMDVDGDCGGFNLYWAWATGILAGRHAAAGEE